MFAACFDVNGGVFEPLLGDEDAIIPDSLNHASIIDGAPASVRPSGTASVNFSDMNESSMLKWPQGGRCRLGVVQSHRQRRRALHGRLHRQAEGKSVRLCPPLRRRPCFGRRLPRDRGTSGREGLWHAAMPPAADRVGIVTGTSGKTLGGGTAGFVAAERAHRRSARANGPAAHLFSNSLVVPPRRRSVEGARRSAYRCRRTARLAEIRCAVVPRRRSRELLYLPSRPVDVDHSGDAGRGAARAKVFLATPSMSADRSSPALFFPVVPKPQARIRTQMSAALTEVDIDFAIAAFRRRGARRWGSCEGKAYRSGAESQW